MLLTNLLFYLTGSIIPLQLQLNPQTHDLQNPAGHVILRAVPTQPGLGGAGQHVQRIRQRPAPRVGHQARQERQGNNGFRSTRTPILVLRVVSTLIGLALVNIFS